MHLQLSSSWLVDTWYVICETCTTVQNTCNRRTPAADPSHSIQVEWGLHHEGRGGEYVQCVEYLSRTKVKSWQDLLLVILGTLRDILHGHVWQYTSWLCNRGAKGGGWGWGWRGIKIQNEDTNSAFRSHGIWRQDQDKRQTQIMSQDNTRKGRLSKDKIPPSRRLLHSKKENSVRFVSGVDITGLNTTTSSSMKPFTIIWYYFDPLARQILFENLGHWGESAPAGQIFDGGGKFQKLESRRDFFWI
jgi:hypothetical protein